MTTPAEAQGVPVVPAIGGAAPVNPIPGRAKS